MRRTLVFLAGVLAALALFSGCGGSGTNPAYLPAGFSQFAYMPNYGAELSAVRYWPARTIRYRIVSMDALDIHSAPLACVPPTAQQADQVRASFGEIEQVLAADPATERHFLEVTPSYPLRPLDAEIDVVWQPKEYFIRPGSVGTTQSWVKTLATGRMGRAVVVLRSDISAERHDAAAQHELGHAMGEQGHSLLPRDVMFASERLLGHQVATLTKRDQNTLKASYWERPPNTRAEISTDAGAYFEEE